MTLRSLASVKEFRRPLRTKSPNSLEPRFGSFPPRCRLLRDPTKAGPRSGKLWRLASQKQPLTGWAVVQAHAGWAELSLCPSRRGSPLGALHEKAAAAKHCGQTGLKEGEKKWFQPRRDKTTESA